MTNEESIARLKDADEMLHEDYGIDLNPAFTLAFIKAEEALEKADKYRWHNLRKNPDDMPTDPLPEFEGFLHKEVLFKCAYGEKEYSYFYSTSMNLKTEKKVLEKKGYIIVGWKYIEPFEVEE